MPIPLKTRASGILVNLDDFHVKVGVRDRAGAREMNVLRVLCRISLEADINRHIQLDFRLAVLAKGDSTQHILNSCKLLFRI